MTKSDLDFVRDRALDLRNRGGKLLGDPNPSSYQLGRTLAEMVQLCQDFVELIDTRSLTPKKPAPK